MFQKNYFHLLCLLRQINITLAFALNSEAQPDGSEDGFLEAVLIKRQLDVSEVDGHWLDSSDRWYTGEHWTFSAQTMILSATTIVTITITTAISSRQDLLKFFSQDQHKRPDQLFDGQVILSFMTEPESRRHTRPPIKTKKNNTQTHTRFSRHNLILK